MTYQVTQAYNEPTVVRFRILKADVTQRDGMPRLKLRCSIDGHMDEEGNIEPMDGIPTKAWFLCVLSPNPKHGDQMMGRYHKKLDSLMNAIGCPALQAPNALEGVAEAKSFIDIKLEDNEPTMVVAHVTTTMGKPRIKEGEDSKYHLAKGYRFLNVYYLDPEASMHFNTLEQKEDK